MNKIVLNRGIPFYTFISRLCLSAISKLIIHWCIVSAQFSAPRLLQVGGGVWVSTQIEGGHRETGRIVSVSPQFSAPVVGESDRPARRMIDGVERDRKETQRWLRCRTIRPGASLPRAGAERNATGAGHSQRRRPGVWGAW